MDIPGDLLVTSTTDELTRHHKSAGAARGGARNDPAAPIGEIDDKELNQLAAHLPDMILNSNLTVDPPFVRQFSGVIMFLDISGFTDLSEKCSSNGSAGSDQLTSILNDYMGAMIDEVLRIQGDVLKFAGDAILVFWKIEDYDHLLRLVKSVIECSCTIQNKYGTWNAEGLATLRVKIALSLGRVYFFVFGIGKHYFYCESGTAVKDAKDAEHLSKSGDVIVSPYMWSYCDVKEYSFSMLDDEKHVKVHGLVTNKETEKAFGLDETGDKATLPFPFSKEAKRKREKDKKEQSEKEAIDANAEGEVYRKAAFETGIHLNETLSKYVTDIVLDKLEAGHGIEYHSEIRSCTIAFINLELTSEELKASKQCDILQQAYEAIAGELEIYKASLNKVVMFDKGCSFLIIFGLPGKKDNYDCKHAVQCAYKIREKLQALPDVLIASAGVTTGHVFCGVVGHDYRHEYTVIGKMVNMAARLMCHYPGMTSCDTETYTHSRIRQHHFKDVPAKELKGLTDVGIIREYTEDSTHISFVATPLHRHTKPLIARERELQVFEEQLAALRNRGQTVTKTPEVNPSSANRASMRNVTFNHAPSQRSVQSDMLKLSGDEVENLLLFESLAETGGSRLLSEIASRCAADSELIVTDLTLTSNDLNRPYLVIRTILGNLLGLPYDEGHVDERHELLTEILLLEFDDEEVQAISKCVEDILLLLADTEEFAVQSADSDQNKVVLQILESILVVAMEHGKRFAVIVIDDSEFMDMVSWSFLINSLSGRRDVMVVMSMLNYEKSAPIEHIDKFLALPTLRRCRVEALPPDDLAIVACQMVDVCAIPIEIEQLLMEKTQGMPGYVRHIMTDLLTSRDIQIVSLLQYQTDFDDFVWPDFEMISGHEPVITRKRSMLRTRNKWAFHTELIPDRDECELRICIITPGSNFSVSLYKTPSSLKSQLLIEFDQITPSEQVTLKCASVIGFVCSSQILHVLWPFPTASLNTALEMLYGKDILRCYNATKQCSGNEVFNHCVCEESTGVSSCRLITFTNHLMRDTVYAILLEEQRTEMHHKVAKFIETSICHLTDEAADELTCQELPFSSEDITNMFVDCKALTMPPERPEFLNPQNKPSLYTFVRMKSSMQHYVADQDSGFCSQKVFDWVENQAAAYLTSSKNSTGAASANKSQNTEELLKSAGDILQGKRGKKVRIRSITRSLKVKAVKVKTTLTRRNSVADKEIRSSISVAKSSQKSGSRRSRAGSMARSGRQGRKKTKTQSLIPTQVGGRRRNASTDGSMSDDKFGSKLSLALKTMMDKPEVEMDILQSRRESLPAGDAQKRPIIGVTEVPLDKKLALFRQALWHWKSSLNTRNTMFTLVEVGCVALQNQLYQQAYVFLKLAHIFTEKIKQKINPLTGEPLNDYCETVEEFWSSHCTKLASLLSVIYGAVGEQAEANSINMDSLGDLGFKLPEKGISIAFEKLKRNLTSVLETSRTCLPLLLQKTTNPLQKSQRVEMSRTLSSFYQSSSQKLKNIRLSQLVLETSINVSKQLGNHFEGMIAYACLIDLNQRMGRFSIIQRIIGKANAITVEANGDGSTKETRAIFQIAELYLHLTILHSALCEGSKEKIKSAAEGMRTLESKLASDDMIKLYTVPNAHRSMLLLNRDEGSRLELLKGLDTIDDLAYFSCLWEEFLMSGFSTNTIVTSWIKDELFSFTQELLDHRLDNMPDDESAAPDIDVYENNILASYVMHMLVMKKFASPIEMQNSVILLEAIQPRELDSYWKVHAYSKILTICIMSLAESKNPNTLAELADKMLKELHLACKPVPAFTSLHKKLSHGMAMWHKDKVLPNDLLPSITSTQAIAVDAIEAGDNKEK